MANLAIPNLFSVNTEFPRQITEAFKENLRLWYDLHSCWVVLFVKKEEYVDSYSHKKYMLLSESNMEFMFYKYIYFFKLTSCIVVYIIKD